MELGYDDWDVLSLSGFDFKDGVGVWFGVVFFVFVVGDGYYYVGMFDLVYVGGKDCVLLVVGVKF